MRGGHQWRLVGEAIGGLALSHGSNRINGTESNVVYMCLIPFHLLYSSHYKEPVLKLLQPDTLPIRAIALDLYCVDHGVLKVGYVDTWPDLKIYTEYYILTLNVIKLVLQKNIKLLLAKGSVE